jgi:hypothetical protein
VVLAVLAMKVRIWFNYIVIFQDIMGLVAELELKALAKVLIALFQVMKPRSKNYTGLA